MDSFGKLILEFSDLIWGTPLLILLVGGGLFFMIHSEMKPLRYLGHAIAALTGKFDDDDTENEEGDISHFQALSTAMAGSVGMGNIAGVAIAVTMGGPGAIFWMWVTAIVGTVTNFYTISLAVMFRGKDDKGEIQGGPMYVISEGLGQKWRWMGVMFAVFAMIGMTPMFNVNQLTEVITSSFIEPMGVEINMWTRLAIGVFLAGLVTKVILGGIQSIAKMAAMLVPFMMVLYFFIVLYIIINNYTNIIPTFQLIFHDAFNADSITGGTLGALIVIGVKRGAFSNEAGVGTAAMAHGAAKTNEPIREGLISMLIPILDTMLVCTLTALAIIITGAWENIDNIAGIDLTLQTFDQAMPGVGKILLSIVVVVFSFTTLLSFPYYGKKSFEFVFGSKYSWIYTVLYIISIPLASVVSLEVVLGLIDSAYALMAFPTMISGLLLAPKVKAAAKDYFARY
ncbi:MAG: alanine:cation symporter family protein [Ichthyobacteriaceae bacterium]|nr:alanine:cation symporter family protein [Ichthyobacteriaceae bacterium]